MQHLNDEALARLVDEAATGDEAAHLAGCGACRRELDALREQTVALRALPLRAPPPAQWGALHERLAAEGMLAPVTSGGRYGIGWPWRAAAALALFLGGSATGYLVRGVEWGRASAPSPLQVATIVEAGDLLQRKEAEYMAALARYSELSGVQRPDDPVSRLAALEGIVLTTRAALEDAPADPVINGYHLTAVGQRDALLRDFETAGPSNVDQEWY